MIDAVIATEDRSFWTNDGIDLGAVFRAFLTNVTSGRIEQGGSTITQQLVKNRLLTSKRDVNRKIKEIEDALRLNEKFSKEKILVEYLNTVYLGSNSYGFKAAAERFFQVCENGCPFGPRGKRLDELTIGETALLAGLISNPEGNSPFTLPRPRHPSPGRRAARRGRGGLHHPGRGRRRQQRAACPTAGAAGGDPPERLPDRRGAEQPAQRSAPGNDREGAPRQGLQGRAEGLHDVRSGDCRLMAIDATTNAKPGSPSGPDWVSSLVAIDPGTGAVKAMVSGQNFADDQTNIATSPYGRQTGSTFKVITLAAALANGYSPQGHRRRHEPVLGAAVSRGRRSTTSPAVGNLRPLGRRRRAR